MWTMQSIDHSVTAAKVELHRRGVIASARLRQPALTLDEIALASSRGSSIDDLRILGDTDRDGRAYMPVAGSLARRQRTRSS